MDDFDDSFLKKQRVLAVGAKGHWLPPFTAGEPSTVKITYPLVQWTKTGKKELVRAKPLTLQLPPMTEGETSAQTDNCMPPKYMLRCWVKYVIKSFMELIRWDIKR